MKSEQFHSKTCKPAPIVVDEASRLTIQGTEPVHVYQLDDNGKKIKLLSSLTNGKLKLNDVEEILLESKGDFNSIIEGPEKIDNTPLEVPVERPLTQTQQLRQWLQNEENMRNYSKQELTWEEFKDLGDLDDGDEFYSQFNPEMTKYEMQAEALRQETNPLRGNPISDKLDEIADNNTNDNVGGTNESTTTTSAEDNSTPVSNGEN